MGKDADAALGFLTFCRPHVAGPRGGGAGGNVRFVATAHRILWAQSEAGVEREVPLWADEEE